jgi:hypothetical protein
MSIGALPTPTAEWLEPDEVAPRPCGPLVTIGDRLRPLARTLMGTPGATAVSTLMTVALLVGGLALRPVSVTGYDAHGVFVARCGMGYYLFGHPNATIRQSCSGAYAGRASVAIASAIVLLLLAVVAVGMVQLRSARSSFVRSLVLVIHDTRRGAFLAAVALASGIIMGGALRTVPVHLRDGAGPLTAHCGLGYQLLGSDNRPVQDACRKAFSSHADVALGCMALLLVASILLVWEVRGSLQHASLTSDSPPESWGSE